MSPATRLRLWVLAVAVGFEGGLAVLAWPLGWLLGRPPLETFRWDLGDAARGAAAALPMVAAGLILARWPVGPLGRVRDFLDEVVRPLLKPCGVPDLALVSAVAGLGEEMLVRGVLQGALAERLGPVPGLVLASLLFGLLHPISGVYVVLATAAGAYLGWVWLATGNLLAPVVTHALYDFAMLVYLLRGAGGDGPEDDRSRSDGPPEDDRAERQ